MQKTLEGKLARINVNHAKNWVTFTLEGGLPVYRLQCPNMGVKASQALDLSQPGDEVAIKFYDRASTLKDGDLASWSNLTLGQNTRVGDSL